MCLPERLRDDQEHTRVQARATGENDQTAPDTADAEDDERGRLLERSARLQRLQSIDARLSDRASARYH